MKKKITVRDTRLSIRETADWQIDCATGEIFIPVSYQCARCGESIERQFEYCPRCEPVTAQAERENCPHGFP